MRVAGTIVAASVVSLLAVGCAKAQAKTETAGSDQVGQAVCQDFRDNVVGPLAGGTMTPAEFRDESKVLAAAAAAGSSKLADGATEMLANATTVVQGSALSPRQAVDPLLAACEAEPLGNQTEPQFSLSNWP